VECRSQNTVDPAGFGLAGRARALHALAHSQARDMKQFMSRVRLVPDVRTGRGFKPRAKSLDKKQNATARVAFCFLWWTRRGLNPRPKAIDGRDYMLISVI
jgi:hypothetical protein